MGSTFLSECPDIHRSVLVFLCDPEIVGSLMLVSREWRTAIADDPTVWGASCEYVWSSKSFVSRQCREQSVAHPRRALRQSIEESQRVSIDAETLCSVRWWFRFKQQAGTAWTRDDPYWREEGARSLEFLPSGVLKWHRGHPDHDMREDEGSMQMRWRLDSDGTVLRVKHNHFSHEFPGVKLIRHPENWGFVFHSVWVVYASFPMCVTKRDRHLSDRILARSLKQWQWTEVEDYNNGVQVQ